MLVGGVNIFYKTNWYSCEKLEYTSRHAGFVSEAENFKLVVMVISLFVNKTSLCSKMNTEAGTQGTGYKHKQGLEPEKEGELGCALPSASLLERKVGNDNVFLPPPVMLE